MYIFNPKPYRILASHGGVSKGPGAAPQIEISMTGRFGPERTLAQT